MNHRLSISAIISVYNGEMYLKEAIQSIFRQTLPPDEIIVVDDGSTDATPAILAQYDGALQVIRQANQGPAAGLNRGIEAASSSWIAFLDADDIWVSNKLEIQRRAISANPALDAIFGHMRQFISPELDPKMHHLFDCPSDPEPAWSKGAALLRRSLFERVGLFDPTWQVGEFIDWFLRARDSGARMAMLDDIVLQRRWHTGNLTTRTDHTDYARIIHTWRQRNRK